MQRQARRSLPHLSREKHLLRNVSILKTRKKWVKTMNNFSDKVIYQIYLRSFKDSNGDGIGDIRGITQQLDYLKELGVDYLWITPFFVSPQNDNGYDVADYRNIDPIFGTMDDLEELLREG